MLGVMWGVMWGVAVAALAGPVLWVPSGCSSRRTSNRDLVLVNPDEASAILSGQKGLLGLGGPGAAAWVDPRSEADFLQGHIPGAINLPFQDVTAGHHRLASYNTLVVYGDDFADTKAQGMSKRLLELGHKDVRTLRGGLRAWIAAGKILEVGERQD
ncbi:MAG: hypothetical protein IH888_09720 [Planctomycetes bacterium]|nr:hypothetical protein [Planctomycetota bacterium]